MRLSTARITNYRCIDDSGEFSIGPVTCLVGKNESGKTAILLALERLKPANASRRKYDKLTDYPRKWLSEYEEKNPGTEAKVLETKWELSAEDANALKALLGADALRSRTVTVSKSYEQESVSIYLTLINES